MQESLFDKAGLGVAVERITAAQAKHIVEFEEGQFVDVKAIEVGPAKISKAISALANADGGDLYIGIDEHDLDGRHWRGFSNQEAANSHLQVFEEHFPLGTDFQYEFLASDGLPGLVLHVQINKSRAIIRASNNIPYVRRGAQSLECVTPEAIKQLEYAKGIASFEDQSTNTPVEAVTTSDVIASFIQRVVPTVTAERWLKKQALVRGDKPTVAGVLIFADEPQAHLPKHCGIKIYRYKTSEAEGFRDALVFDPETIEGCLYDQIKAAVARTIELVESIPRMGETELEAIKYPPETLHEIITNAVLHRDYSVADDVHIRIFDNRIEVQSPGKLPAHVTVNNILNERFARNGAVVRIVNKFPDAPNKDVGEGLNTAFNAMHELGFKAPVIKEQENSVLVVIRHETLASPEEAIMEYLEKNSTIKNREAREITHIRQDYQIKSIFGRMVDAEMIEQVPNTRTSGTAYRKKQKPE